MAPERLWLIGAGGHGKVAVATARAAGRHVAGVFDDHPAARGQSLLGAPVTSPVPLGPRAGEIHVAVGSNAARERIVAARDGWNWVSIRHPSAWIDASAVIGSGVLICAGAIIQAGATVGDHAIINTGAIVEHDCRIGDYCHIAPGVALAGTVTVGEGAFVGIGSCVTPGITIGAWATVGAGAVVIRDVPPGATVVGNPARGLAKSSPALA